MLQPKDLSNNGIGLLYESKIENQTYTFPSNGILVLRCNWVYGSYVVATINGLTFCNGSNAANNDATYPTMVIPVFTGMTASVFDYKGDYASIVFYPYIYE